MKDKIIIIGAGAWGTALANMMAKNNHDVCLISNKSEIAQEINQNHSNNKFLPQVSLSKNLRSSLDLQGQIADADYVFIVTPSLACAQVIEEIANLKIKNSCGLVLCTKGLHHQKLEFFHNIIEKNLQGKNYAILSGPNFAAEVAAEVPSVTTIASKNQTFANKIIGFLQNNYFKAHYSPDVVAVEICGVMKNIIAIGCGIVDGLKLGENAKAALVLRGLHEIELLSKKLNGGADFNSAAGFGDIFLTCSTTKSRNNSLGSSIAQGLDVAQLLSAKKTYEGAVSAKSVAQLISRLELKLVLCETIDEILQNSYSLQDIKHKISLAILA